MSGETKQQNATSKNQPNTRKSDSDATITKSAILLFLGNETKFLMIKKGKLWTIPLGKRVGHESPWKTINR